MRSLIGVYEAKRDLITLGAYQAGSDAQVDRAIAAMPSIQQLVQQAADATNGMPQTLKQLSDIANKFGAR